MASIIDLKYSLPEELWVDILKHVSSQDALKVIREYPHISNAVHPYKALLLFGKVVPFLTDWSENRGKNGLLTLEDLHSCRLVCKNWSGEIDLMFQTVDYKLVATSNSWQSDLDRFNLKDDSWTSSLNIEFMFLSDFEVFSMQFETLAGNRNPFPSRTFKIHITDRFYFESEEENLIESGGLEAANEEYWTTLINFLQKFGKYIEHFRLRTSFGIDECHHVNGVVQIKNLAKCLRLLPNLRSILLDANCGKWDFNSLAELETTVASEFLNVPKVEIARFCFELQKPQLYTSFLTAFNQSIKHLSLLRLPDHCKLPAMPALREIHLRSVTCPEDLEYLYKVTQIAPNLCKFTFSLDDPTTEMKSNVIQASTKFYNGKKFKLESEREEKVLPWQHITSRVTLSFVL